MAQPNRPLNWLALVLALLVAGTAWMIPSRWRTLHPAVVEAAGRSTPGLVELATAVARYQKVGPAGQLVVAAGQLGLPGTNAVAAALPATGSPEVRYLGGMDPVLAALLPRTFGHSQSQYTAVEVFLPEDNRKFILAGLSGSRSPGVQSLIRTRDLELGQFVPVSKPGGQALDSAALLAAALYERERFSPELSRELRSNAEMASTSSGARQTLEEFYLSLLSLGRRLDWTSLAELTATTRNIRDLNQFAAAVRTHPSDLAIIFSAAVVSGNSGSIARLLNEWGDAGRQGLVFALRNGSGAVQLISRSGQIVRPGWPSPESLSVAVLRAPLVWAGIRTGLMVIAAALGVWSLRGFARGSGEVPPPTGWAGVTLGAGATLGLALLLVVSSEPLPSRPQKSPSPAARLDFKALTNPSPVANSSKPKKYIMEPTTLVTMAIFGAIQLAVYVICVRKIREIASLPEPPPVRLRLLENEENLFDSGLYVGIGGTAAALVMQVLQLVEANLLAAYSSNLMGIICVAVVKIGHVRRARRQLILECAESAAESEVGSAVEAVPTANPFTTR